MGLVMSNFWDGKNVAVTGANGFVGSWLTEKLVRNGANVTILLDPKCPIKTDSIRHLENGLKIVKGDIRDKSVEDLVKDKEMIFHLAAVTQVIYAKENPVETFDVNANGTLNILEAIRKGNSNAFLVFTSTDKVYGESKYLPVDEEHPLLGKSPYDASKLAADRMVQAYNNTYGMGASISRWANTIGGRDANILRAAPDFITSIMNNRPATIRGNGRHIRDYMYVADAVDGILSLAEDSKISNGQAFNFGTEKPTSVIEIAEMISKAMDSKSSTVVLNKPTEGEIDKQYLSSEKARSVLKWSPRFKLEESIAETIKWYISNQWWMETMKRVAKHYNLQTAW